jgi:hypothetical protein
LRRAVKRGVSLRMGIFIHRQGQTQMPCSREALWNADDVPAKLSAVVDDATTLALNSEDSSSNGAVLALLELSRRRRGTVPLVRIRRCRSTLSPVRRLWRHLAPQTAMTRNCNDAYTRWSVLATWWQLAGAQRASNGGARAAAKLFLPALRVPRIYSCR